MRDNQQCTILAHFIYGKYKWGHFEIKQLNSTQSQYNKIEWTAGDKTMWQVIADIIKSKKYDKIKIKRIIQDGLYKIKQCPCKSFSKITGNKCIETCTHFQRLTKNEKRIKCSYKYYKEQINEN